MLISMNIQVFTNYQIIAVLSIKKNQLFSVRNTSIIKIEKQLKGKCLRGQQEFLKSRIYMFFQMFKNENTQKM